MKRKILQSLADSIIKKIEKAENEQSINFYYEMGLTLDRISLSFGIELI